MSAPRSLRVALAIVLAQLAACSLLAASALASNDASSSATRLAYGRPDLANTSAYGVQAGEPNTTAPFAQTCGSGFQVGVARTAWYMLRGTGHRVIVTTEGSGFDTAMFAYAGSPSGSLLSCNDDISGADFASSTSFHTALGKSYAIQIGRACNATGPPACASLPSGGALRIVAQDFPEHPALAATTGLFVAFNAHYTSVTSLNVTGAPAGAKVTVLCQTHAKGCPFAARSRTAGSAAKLKLGKWLKNAHLKNGAKLSVRTTKPGFIGVLTRYTIHVGRPFDTQQFCLEPGSTKPRKSCS